MKTNRKMMQYLQSLKINNNQNVKVDLIKIEDVIFPDFFEWDGCILLRQKENINLDDHFSTNKFTPDRTAFEASYNHIHLNELFDTALDVDSLLNIGVKLINIWSAILFQKYSPSKRFMIILSYDGEDIVLRFYTIRDHELAWLDLSKLESYEEGLMILSV